MPTNVESEYPEMDDELDPIVEEKMDRIARFYYLSYVTDDNPSPFNELTGLEQVVNYEFDLEDEFESSDVIDDIVSRAKVMKSFQSEELYRNPNEVETRAILIKLAKGIYIDLLTEDNPSRWNELTGLEQAICYEFGPRSKEEIKNIRKRLLRVQHELNGGFRLKKIKDLNDFPLTQD